MTETNSITPLDLANAAAARTYTQDEVNKILADSKRRLRDKYADYEELKAKAARLDAGDTANQELEAAQQRADDAETKLNEYLDNKMRVDIANTHNVPVEMLEGNNQEELTAYAENLRTFLDGRRTPAPDPSQGLIHNNPEPFSDDFARQLGKALNLKYF